MIEYIFVVCLACCHRQKLENVYLDDMGYFTTCKECESSFDIANEIAKRFEELNNTKIIKYY